MATYLGSKYQEYDMGNKIIDGGAATLKGLAEAGKFIYKLSKPVVKYASIRAVQGVGYLCKQAEFQLSDDENDSDEDDVDNVKDKNKKNKKSKKNKKKKEQNIENQNYNNNIINNVSDNNSNINNNNQGNSFCLKEGQYIFEPSIDYPTFESINKVDLDKNFNQNNFNQNDNYYQNQNNNISQQININNNHNITPDYVIPPGLECSSHENSIIGEKENFH